MSEFLDEEIAAIEYVLANRLVDGQMAEALTSAKAKLQFVKKHESGIRAYVEEIRKAKEHPQVKAALTNFPDAEIIAVRKTS